MGISVQEQLISDLFGEEFKQLSRIVRYFVQNEGFQLLSVLTLDASHLLVDFTDKDVHLRNELHKSLGNQHHSVVLALSCSLYDNLHQVGHQFLQSLPFGLDLFTNEGVSRFGQQGTFQRNVRS
jgi:hypothetical protein